MAKYTNMEETNTQQKKFFARNWVRSLIIMIVVFGSLGGYIYYATTVNTIMIDTSHLQAPVSNVSPTSPGTLNAVYVKDGDHVAANTPLALVGSETVYAKTSGIVSGVPRVVGSYYAPGQTIMSILAVDKMRVVGKIDETNGLDKIVPGQRVTFTVDAFPGKQYQGVVDEISPASNDAGIAFNISDKRPVKQFDVYVRYDTTKYPELRSGMSARIWVHLR